MAYLQATNGPAAGTRYDLTGPKHVLGRHPDCDIIVDVGAVSRHHAVITAAAEQVFVEDLKSRNGTFVNGQATQGRFELSPGDKIQICDVIFDFLSEHAPAVEPGRETTRDPGTETLLSSSVCTPALLVDDDPETGTSTIMSKLEVSSASGVVQVSASADVKLAALLEITQSMGKALGLDEVLPQVLNSLFKIFVQADRGFIVLKAADGALIPRWTKTRREDDDEAIRISRTIINQVIDSQEAILSADAASDSRFEMSQSIADFRIRSMLCAPLVTSDGTALGALQIDTLDQRSRFQAEDLEVLASVASQAAIAIDNAQLHEYALHQRALERDLELASAVQEGFLPDCSPDIEGLRFYDFYNAAGSVGGDYYDYIELSGNRLAIVVADVVGHGVAAALLMAKLSAEVQVALVSGAAPSEAMNRLNSRLSKDGVSDRFVTMVVVVMQLDTDEFTVVNAGHMTPIVRRSGGEIEEVGEPEVGIPLGIIDDFEYEQCTASLAANELMVLYTDGINEAMDPDGQLYGIERIHAQISGDISDVERLGAKVIDDVNGFMGGQDQNDDMCLVCVARGGEPKAGISSQEQEVSSG